MKFLLDQVFKNKKLIDIKDNFGRTPLHIAAAVNYPEMCTFLIKEAEGT